MQQLFLEADRVVPGLVATQAVGGLATAATLAPGAVEAFFDDDLDVGAKAPSASWGGGGGGAPSSSTSLVAACRQRCIELLLLMGPLQPVDAKQAVLHWLGWSAEGGGGARHEPLAPEQHLGLVDVLVACALRTLRVDPAVGLQVAGAAVGQLGGEHGVLAWSKFHNNQMLFVVERVGELAETLAPHTGEAPPQAGLEALEALAGLLDECSRKVEVEEKKAAKKLSSWQLRVAMARAAAALLRADPALVAADFAEELIGGLLEDDAYPARLEGGRLVQALLAGAREAPGTAFAALKRRLCLQSTQVTVKEGVDEAMETSVCMLGECVLVAVAVVTVVVVAVVVGGAGCSRRGGSGRKCESWGAGLSSPLWPQVHSGCRCWLGQFWAHQWNIGGGSANLAPWVVVAPARCHGRWTCMSRVGSPSPQNYTP